VAQLFSLDLIAMPMPLANPEAKSDLIRWDVPFANAGYPSISVITDSDTSKIVLVVRPRGFVNYPHYLVRFYNVVTLLRYDEGPGAFDTGYRSLIRSEYNLCAYRWITSPWLLGYSDHKRSDEEYSHYLLLGADDIVEVIALGEVEVERVDKQIVMEMKYEV
jgi:hypothetical protein